MKLKKLLGSISCLLIIALLFSVINPALTASALEAEAPTQTQTEYEDYTVLDDETRVEIQSEEDEIQPVYEDGCILIYHYGQLRLIGSGAPLTDTDYLTDGVGGGDPLTADGAEPLIYGSDCRYRIVRDIALPRHTGWQLPDGFSGVVIGSAEQDAPLYDAGSDTIYVYHPYQLAVMAAEDAAIQPVLSGDAVASTFGTGKVIETGDGGYLTYSGNHRYVIRSRFSSAVGEPSVSVRRNKELAQTSAVQPTDGRDFVGQVIKKIDGKTYILIGNEDQLRAIGTNTEVYTPVYKMKDAGINKYQVATDRNGNPIVLYGGDADLLQTQNGYADFSFQQITGEYPRAGVNQDTGEVYADNTHVDASSLGTAHSWETGVKYTTNANYIIFRDIDLGGSFLSWRNGVTRI